MSLFWVDISNDKNLMGINVTTDLILIYIVSGSLSRFVSTSTNVKPIQMSPSVLLITATKPSFSVPSLTRIPKSRSILDVPIEINKIISDIPKVILPIEDIVIKDAIEDPTKVIEQKAERLIVIRRKKMKKHKLKKWRKKMKFVNAKLRQKREMMKEKAFQAELMTQIGEAEKFNPVLYAKEKIDKKNAVLIPKLWKGKRLPEFVIRDLLAEREAKLKKKEESLERRKNMNLKVSEYKV